MANNSNKRPGGPGGPAGGIPPALRQWVLVIAGFLGVFLLLQAVGSLSFVEVPYSDFKDAVREGRVARVDVGATALTGYPVEGSGADEKALRAVRVTGDDALIPLLDERGIPYRGLVETGCMNGPVGMFLLPMLIVFAFWMFMMRRGPGAQAFSFGRSRAKLHPEKSIEVRFGDVAGCDEAKEELAEVVDFLQTPERFHALGARIPRGVLLVGPPGTGKTLLARAVAGEAGVPFYSISGSDFVEMFVGVGAARVRDLFEQAKAASPCIIFLDELDAVGKARGPGNMPGGNDEREQTLNALLVEMDGFDPRSGVMVLAATNRPETLDPALLRAGRFDRQVLVDRPDLRGRVEILNIHLRKVVLGPGIDPEDLARQTTGFVGADLANVVNEAALLAARRRAASVEPRDFREAIERVIAGLEKKNRRMNPREKEIVAFHESGHAIVARAMPTSDPVRRVSIVPRGMGALGYTLQMPTEDRYLMSRQELLDRIAGLLGGRAAEEVALGEISTGAQNDLQRVTEMARRMTLEFGMTDAVGLVHLGGSGRPRFLDAGALDATPVSDATADAIDGEIRRIIDSQYDRAREALRCNRALLDEMARRLLEVEVLEEQELDGFLQRVRHVDPA